MKRSLMIGVLVLAMMASVIGMASAHGNVFVGVHSNGTGSDLVPFVAAEFQVSEELAIIPRYYVDEVYGVRVRYGVGTGGYGSVVFDANGVENWRVGAFFEHMLSERLATRVNIGLIGFPDGDVVPDADLDFKYSLSGPWSLKGLVSYGIVQAAVGFDF